MFSQWHLQIFSAFLADISVFSPCAAADFPSLFCQFLDIFSLPPVSLFFVVLFAVFLQEPLSSFCSFILVKVVIYFLEFWLEFLFVLAICYCNQSTSIIFNCVHHFLISATWKQQYHVFLISFQFLSKYLS